MRNNDIRQKHTRRKKKERDNTAHTHRQGKATAHIHTGEGKKK